MRRALLAATLVAMALAPVAARAQVTLTAGQVTFNNQPQGFIGADGCSSTASGTFTVDLAWQDQPETPVFSNSNGVFKIYATNIQPTANLNGAIYCPIQDNPNNTGGLLFAGQIGGQIANSGGTMLGTVTVNTNSIAVAAGYGACTQDGANIFVCAQFYPYALNGTTPTGTPTAWAIGTMTLSLAKPVAVILTRALPGDGALNVSWTDPGTAAQYKVRALSMLDPTKLPAPGDFDPANVYSNFDPRDQARHESDFITGKSLRFSKGFVNGVTYGVAVYAFSSAQTPSDPSNVLSTEALQANDFWDLYKADGGKEAGGCGAGAAGPLGLGVLLATLALVRRRK